MCLPDVEVLHEAEEPSTRIFAGLLEAFPGTPSALLTDSIPADSRDAELLFFGSEPSGLRRVVRKEDKPKEGHDSGHSAFNDEQP